MTRPTLTRTLAALALAAVLGWLLTLNWWLFGAAIVLGSLTCIALGAFDEPDQPHPLDPHTEQQRERLRRELAMGQMRRRAERVRGGDGF